jgi:hypothetical protein
LVLPLLLLLLLPVCALAPPLLPVAAAHQLVAPACHLDCCKSCHHMLQPAKGWHQLPPVTHCHEGCGPCCQTRRVGRCCSASGSTHTLPTGHAMKHTPGTLICTHPLAAAAGSIRASTRACWCEAHPCPHPGLHALLLLTAKYTPTGPCYESTPLSMPATHLLDAAGSMPMPTRGML